MIYLDTSVALSHLLAEDRQPRTELWEQPLVASRLLVYELLTRLNTRDLARTHGDAARMLLGRVALLDLTPPVLARALEPFPKPVRTLDALHLASAMFLRERGHDLTIATFDARMATAAMSMGLGLFDV